MILEQVGGAEGDGEGEGEGDTGGGAVVDTITLRVRDASGEEMLFKVKKGTKFSVCIIV